MEINFGVLHYAINILSFAIASHDFCTHRPKPLIIGHRGSPGILPEHTVEGYQLAVDVGADVIECDVAVSKDLKLLCTHEAWLNATTDVWSRGEFRDRVKTYYIPARDEYRTDFFTTDFTLAELKTLNRVQVFSFRNHAYDGKFKMASLDDYISVAKNSKSVKIYVETKNPQFFNNYLQQHSTKMEDLLIESLKSHGFAHKESPAFIESFNIQSLEYMSQFTPLPLVYLTENTTSDEFMSHISRFVSVVCPAKNFIVEVDPATNMIAKKTDFVERARRHGLQLVAHTCNKTLRRDVVLIYKKFTVAMKHAELVALTTLLQTLFDVKTSGPFDMRGSVEIFLAWQNSIPNHVKTSRLFSQVHCFTFRNENRFLAFDYGADPYKEYALFVEMGVDGMFTDFPWSLKNYLRTREHDCK